MSGEAAYPLMVQPRADGSIGIGYMKDGAFVCVWIYSLSPWSPFSFEKRNTEE